MSKKIIVEINGEKASYVKSQKHILRLVHGRMYLLYKIDLGKYKGIYYYKCKKCTLIVSDISEYSLFIKKDLSKYKFILIWSKKMSGGLQTKDIISSPSGSILYFDKPINNVFKKGCIYPAFTAIRPDLYLDGLPAYNPY